MTTTFKPFDWSSVVAGDPPAPTAPEMPPAPHVEGPPLDAAGIPDRPCPRCDSRAFWRPSLSTEPWRCHRCVPPLPRVRADSVTLPPSQQEARW